MASDRKAPSPDTLRTHRPGWRYGAGGGCGALLELPDWPTGGFCGETGKICADCSADRGVDVGELAALCTRIQQNAHAIPVRVNISAAGWESKFLSELPAELAVWWALHFVLRRLLGPVVDESPAERFAAPDGAGWHCGECGEINPPTSGQCKRCGVRIGPDRAQLAYDVGPGDATAVDREDEPAMGAAPANVAISVDVAEVAGARVVKLVLPAGAKSVAVALPPNTADALAKALAQQARIARSPAGLILPRS